MTSDSSHSVPDFISNPRITPTSRATQARFPAGFPWLLLAGILAATWGSHWFAIELRGLGRYFCSCGCGAVVLTLLVAFATSVSAGLLFWNRHLWHRERPGWMFLPLTVFVAGIQWMAIDLHSLMAHSSHTAPTLPGLSSGLAGLVMFIFGVLLAQRQRHHLERARTEKQILATVYQPGLRALVIPVSRPSSSIVFTEPTLRTGVVRFDPPQQSATPGTPPAVSAITITPADIADAISQLDDPAWKTARCSHNWQQLLRGVEPHIKTLKHLRLIGSRGNDLVDGTSLPGYLLDACALLAPYLKNLESVSYSEAIDFDDFEQVRDALTAGIRDLERDGIPLEQIAIELTGGPKIASIAGAAVTLNSRVIAQYVESRSYSDTSSAPPRVLIYDLDWDKSLPGE